MPTSSCTSPTPPRRSWTSRSTPCGACSARSGAGDIPEVLALNKIDQVAGSARARLARRFPGSVAVSASTGEGADGLARGPGRRRSRIPRSRSRCSSRGARRRHGPAVPGGRGALETETDGGRDRGPRAGGLRELLSAIRELRAVDQARAAELSGLPIRHRSPGRSTPPRSPCPGPAFVRARIAGRGAATEP